MAWMKNRIRVTLPLLVLLALPVALAGCINDGDSPFSTFSKKRELPPEPPPRPAQGSDAVSSDTVGAVTLLGNASPLVLRGFGVVIGLGENGGSDCPTTIRRFVVEQLDREFAPRDTNNARAPVSASDLVDSSDTAVVEVFGAVPAAAVKGAKFDLQVRAIGNQTRSLEGGILLPCDMKAYDPTAGGRDVVGGRALARAGGRIFTNPLASTREPEDVRVGLVLGGGVTIAAREFRLLLRDPSYAAARQIERIINERFGQHPTIATAESQGFVKVLTPIEHAEEPGHFMDLVTHLLRQNAPAYYDQQLLEFQGMVRDDPRTMQQLSLIWEAVGRVSIQSIQPLYEHPAEVVRFFAARAGLRLGDASAIATVSAVAATPSSPWALSATEELGVAPLAQVGIYLSPLLDSESDVVRVAAYEALSRRGHPAIRRVRYADPIEPRVARLTLDVVRSTRSGLIYVRTTGEPRIAIFGEDFPVSTPIFFSHPNEWVMINAVDRQSNITLLSRTLTRGLLSDPIVVPARLDELIRGMAALPIRSEAGTYAGLGLHYSLVVEVLDSLTRDGMLAARVIYDQPATMDLLTPPTAPTRPEADDFESAPPAASAGDAGADGR